MSKFFVIDDDFGVMTLSILSDASSRSFLLSMSTWNERVPFSRCVPPGVVGDVGDVGSPLASMDSDFRGNFFPFVAELLRRSPPKSEERRFFLVLGDVAAASASAVSSPRAAGLAPRTRRTRPAQLLV